MNTNDEMTMTPPPVQDEKRQVSAERPHACPECGKGYMDARGLGVHRRQTHGIWGQSASSIANRAAKATGRTKPRKYHYHRKNVSNGIDPSPVRRQAMRLQTEGAQLRPLKARFCPVCRCPMHLVEAALAYPGA